MSVTRNYARHLRVITVLQTITLQLRIVTRKVRNYGVITQNVITGVITRAKTSNHRRLPCPTRQSTDLNGMSTGLAQHDEWHKTKATSDDRRRTKRPPSVSRLPEYAQ